MPNETHPVVCRNTGAYTDADGVTHTMKPGDVVPLDAKSCVVDCTFTNDPREELRVS